VSAQASSPEAAGNDAVEKKPLDAYFQQDAGYTTPIGITSADAASAMPAATADHPPPTIGVDLMGSLPGQSPGGALAANTAHDQPLTTRAAQAVETVAALVDAQASRTQGTASSVRLNFNFEGDDLAVRIELSNGVVHTQFRTDSPDLRGAIASEWQVSSPATQGRELIFLPPSFSGASGQSDAALTSDGGASRRQTAEDLEPQSQTWAPSSFEKASTPGTAAPAGPASIPTARHLQTFA
jgi:hypothetical protein